MSALNPQCRYTPALERSSNPKDPSGWVAEMEEDFDNGQWVFIWDYRTLALENACLKAQVRALQILACSSVVEPRPVKSVVPGSSPGAPATNEK